MQTYKIEYLDKLNGGEVVHFEFVDAESVAEAEAFAKMRFAPAQLDFGARHYQVLEPVTQRVVAMGPGGF